MADNRAFTSHIRTRNKQYLRRLSIDMHVVRHEAALAQLTLYNRVTALAYLQARAIVYLRTHILLQFGQLGKRTHDVNPRHRARDALHLGGPLGYAVAER